MASDFHQYLSIKHLYDCLRLTHSPRHRPPPQNQPEFKCGDTLEVFLYNRLQEGHVTQDLQNGKFRVSFKDSTEMALPMPQESEPFPKIFFISIQHHTNSSVFFATLLGKRVIVVVPSLSLHPCELPRILLKEIGVFGNVDTDGGVWLLNKWISQNQVSSDRDIISELPDNVLLHIMDLLETKEAVKTCVLSKRWQHLCKGLINLIYDPEYDISITILIERFKKFASWVLINRDVSYSLRNLTVNTDWTDSELLDKVVKHALFCNVQELSLKIFSGFRPSFESLPLIFCCKSLASLELCNNGISCQAKLPKSLYLPVLKRLCLKCFRFTPSDDDFVEPFSNCYVLHTLVLQYCALPEGAQVFCISNSTLSSLTISGLQACRIELSTPNICSFTFSGIFGHQLFSTCDFPFLGEVSINVNYAEIQNEKISIIMKWLKVLANVKTLTLYPGAFATIIDALRYHNSGEPHQQPPSFVRLESLRVNRNLFLKMPDRMGNALVKYLLQNSPTDKIDFISF